MIDAYLNKHRKYDDATADRLQEELQSIYNKFVKDKPPAFGPWIAIFRRLIPVLRTPERILGWWDICGEILDTPTHEKAVVSESYAGMMDVIALAEEQMESPDADVSSSPFIDRLFTCWMDRFYPAWRDGSTAVQYSERLTRDALINFGKRHPKVCLQASRLAMALWWLT